MSEPGFTPDAAPDSALAPQARLPIRGRKRTALTASEASAGMLVRQLRVHAPDVVFVKGVIEASEGLAVLFAERGGDLTIATPFDRAAELGQLLLDLTREIGGTLDSPVVPGDPSTTQEPLPKVSGLL